MEYKYEMHCHTGTVSLCAKTEPKELVKMYAGLGYSGLVLTDHYSPMTFWGRKLFRADEMAEFYLTAYRELKDHGGDDFTVLLGMELRHYATGNDYLIYGVEEDWLLKQPNMLRWGMKKRYEETQKAGYLLFQAHPYRPYIHRCAPDYIDGIEIWNGHTKKEANERAAAWAKETGKLIVSGGDCHALDDAHGGIVTQKPIKNNADLLDVLRSQDFTPIPIYKPEK
ncbi:MAG: PHP domain-containing protein [Clostridia bacterium]|nr:PHP domain-containing protein [Clostridia bacterium]